MKFNKLYIPVWRWKVLVHPYNSGPCANVSGVLDLCSSNSQANVCFVQYTREQQNPHICTLYISNLTLPGLPRYMPPSMPIQKTDTSTPLLRRVSKIQLNKSRTAIKIPLSSTQTFHVLHPHSPIHSPTHLSSSTTSTTTYQQCWSQSSSHPPPWISATYHSLSSCYSLQSCYISGLY